MNNCGIRFGKTSPLQMFGAISCQRNKTLTPGMWTPSLLPREIFTKIVPDSFNSSLIDALPQFDPVHPLSGRVAKLCPPTQLQQIIQKVAGETISCEQIQHTYEAVEAGLKKGPRVSPIQDTPIEVVTTQKVVAFVIGELGQGAFKDVSVVVKLKNGQNPVVEAFAWAPYPEDLSVIQDERELMRSCLGDSSIVQLTEECEKENNFFFMEYCEGGTLKEALPTLSSQDRLRLSGECAHAVSLLARKNIIHRDIKSENIFLKKDGKGIVHVKLGDLGTGCRKTDRQKRQVWAGTPLFWSPEQARSKNGFFDKHDKYMDAWALGCVLYSLYHPQSQELLEQFLNEEERIEELKKQGKSETQAQECVRKEGLDILRRFSDNSIQSAIIRLREDTPPAIQQVIKGLLTVDPDKRMTSHTAALLLESAAKQHA